MATPITVHGRKNDSLRLLLYDKRATTFSCAFVCLACVRRERESVSEEVKYFLPCVMEVACLSLSFSFYFYFPLKSKKEGHRFCDVCCFHDCFYGTTAESAESRFFSSYFFVFRGGGWSCFCMSSFDSSGGSKESTYFYDTMAKGVRGESEG